ncbi:integrase arm-type DNA-binding domain-containing protein [Polynucleobacter sp. MWH-Mekk-B1]|uniref:tyrosine-type recombinase/integrase n=1 Tax=Polynucleobacter finlandensis TaxID=1855894 RepID=UPI001C0DFCFC|nr:site-specific integrase [Polynucleobacter finlandensis]MBU3545008.1 integrase arm-type DNA-binding domain-containing protein [Polynucleobacter finlandensis]
MKLTYQSALKITKSGRYFDHASSLHLWVKSPTQKYWILRYMARGKRQDMSLGSINVVPLQEARKKALEAQIELSQGINPLEKKKANKKAIESKKAQVQFKDFALECVESKSHEWRSSKHHDQWLYTLKEFAFPVIGDKPIEQVNTEDILKILKPIWKTKTNTASRLRGRLEWIISSAIAREYFTQNNPAVWRGHLQTILSAPNKTAKTKHHPALQYKELPMLMLKLKSMEGISALALEFTILNASRTGEVIGGLRSEVDGSVWIIPAERMKGNREHRVPLCTRSIEILAIASMLDPNSPYLFSKNGKALSNMAMTMVLRRLKIGITVHGFRSTFRDWVSEETSTPSEVAEMALAHAISNKTESSYRRGDLLARRRELMNLWEGFCASAAIDNIIELKVA